MILLIQEVLDQQEERCNCEVYFGLDWIIDDSTVVRPDIMLVCGKFEDDFLCFPPSLIIEITSKRTQIADRNGKFKIYEGQRVSYYLIVDPERKTVETFSLIKDAYKRTETSLFLLDTDYRLEPDLEKLWT